MSMLLSTINRAPLLGAALSFALAACLSGCVSKNPLIDGPEASTPVAKAPAGTVPATTAPVAPVAVAPVSTPAGGMASSAEAGAQTTGPTGMRRFMGIFSPYRVDIQQGNFVTEEMVSQLKEGQTREQVRFILGTPLLTDIFHAERWDYPFRILKGNGETTTSRVTVFFKDNRVVRFEGGDLPTEKDYLDRIAGSRGSKHAVTDKADSPAPQAK